ncbi:MAG TPA: DNA-3-methyladenine glycosylase [Acidimicrobiales bacterium]|jgi:DNA-3-methyladenine glycosylase
MTARRGGRRLPRGFFEDRALEVAPRLLNTVIWVGDRAGRIIEVEAYEGADDPASHAFGGRTARNATMFERGGHLYAYRSYGIHTCVNVVCGPPGLASAVLLRAVAPVAGISLMRSDRPAARHDRDLANGPGKLTRALGLTIDHDGADLCARQSPIELRDDGVPPPVSPRVAPRVGISRASDRPWRFRQ